MGSKAPFAYRRSIQLHATVLHNQSSYKQVVILYHLVAQEKLCRTPKTGEFRPFLYIYMKLQIKEIRIKEFLVKSTSGLRNWHTCGIHIPMSVLLVLQILDFDRQSIVEPIISIIL